MFGRGDGWRPGLSLAADAAAGVGSYIIWDWAQKVFSAHLRIKILVFYAALLFMKERGNEA